jgi:myo-inositol catabolism protein IolS
MEYVRLNQTDLNVSRVGFGCAAIGGYDYGKADDRVSIRAINEAIDLGVNFFDTADVYGLGHAEELLGQALGSRRHDVIVATKFGVDWDETGNTQLDISPERVSRALDESLRRLKLDCIPLYQIHWPDGKTPIAQTIEALRRSQEAGKIRYIGCCNFPLNLIEEAQTSGRIASLQLPYSLVEREPENLLRDAHNRLRMATLCYNPLAQGLLTGKYCRESKFDSSDLRSRSTLFQGDKFDLNLSVVEKVKIVAQRLGRTPAQVAVRWLLDNDFIDCALVGIRTSAQLKENSEITGWQLSAADAEFLRAAMPLPAN